MSGPKVVRIVTVEEVIATCKGHLARLDRSIKQWQKSMEKFGELDQAFYQAMVDKRKVFDSMLEEQRFLDIQKLVPMEIASISDNIEQRHQLKVSEKARSAIQEKQAKENIKALINLLNNKHVISEDLDNDLQDAIKGKYQGNINQLMMNAFNLLTPQETTKLSQRQQALLSRMAVDNTQQNFATWLEKQNSELQKDSYIQRIESYLAELALEQKEIYDVFAERLNIIEREMPYSRHKLLLDSFVLDLAQAVKENKERRALQSHLELLIAELQQKTTDSADFNLNSLDNTNIKELKALVNNCEQTLAQVTQKTIATYRQQAILQGLASLGYEVRQNMQTQWTKDGKLVLRNPSTPGYGIELAGKTEASRMQVRAVKLTCEDTQQRDNDVETLWCGDFAKLQKWLAKQGSDLIIEKALPIGAVPLKAVVMDDIDSSGKNAVQQQILSSKLQS